jgi:uncharacterized DUF497 family protein
LYIQAYILVVQVEWDESKSERNILERAIDFADAARGPDLCRVISMRKANEREAAFYAQRTR